MKKARLFCTILLIGIISLSIITDMETLPLSKASDKIINKLMTEGHKIEKMCFEKDTVTATAILTRKDFTGPNTILAFRAVSNEVKALALKDDGALKGMKSVRQIVKNSDNEIISEFGSGRIQPKIIGEDAIQLKNGSIRHTKKETKRLLQETFKQQGISANINEIKESKLVGYLVVLEITDHNNDIDMIDSTVRQIKSAISKLNIDGAMIGEFILSATDANDSNEIIYLMAADLMFGEFLWWQAPEFGRLSWRH